MGDRVITRRVGHCAVLQQAVIHTLDTGRGTVGLTIDCTSIWPRNIQAHYTSKITDWKRGRSTSISTPLF